MPLLLSFQWRVDGQIFSPILLTMMGDEKGVADTVLVAHDRLEFGQRLAYALELSENGKGYPGRYHSP